MTEYLFVEGGRTLSGEVTVSGAKNAALPLLIATLLSSEPCVITNVPDLEDISPLLRILSSLGARASFSNNTVEIHTPSITSVEAPYGLVKAMRASFWVLGPLLARHGKAMVSLPGGDAIGTRPVDLHLKGLAKLGAHVEMRHGVVVATAPGGLHPAQIHFDFPSVGATHQLLMTAALIPGETILHNAAREPEIVEVATLLTAMGCEIEGAGTETIVIRGRRELGGAKHRVCGDRIEAATYLAAAAATGGRIHVRGIERSMMSAVVAVLEQAGCGINDVEDGLYLWAPPQLTGVTFETAPFPGVATDAQPMLLAALTRASGVSFLKETVFENRFGYVAEYRRFGAQIELDGRLARIVGVPSLTGAPVECSDIRAAVGLVIMGLMAEGVTSLSELHHLDRGYEGLVGKFSRLGAKITRMPAFEEREVVIGC